MSKLVNNSFEDKSKLKLQITKRRRKNDYVKLEAGAYPRMLLQQLEEAAAALATGDLSATKMVRLNKRSGRYLITMGLGKRNTWFENDYIAQGEVAECEDAMEALMAILRLKEIAKTGEFDKALEDLRIQRQEHAVTMIEARDVCGFHRNIKREPLKLLEGPAAIALSE